MALFGVHDAGTLLSVARMRRVLPRRPGLATLYLFLAYWIITALGILLSTG